MKKILCILPAAVAILLTSCGDRGTTTEVTESNEDEYVNPSHLGQYNWPGMNAQTLYSTDTPIPADQLVRDYYLTTPEQYYNVSAAQRVGKTTTNMPEDNATNKNQGSTMAPGSTTADGQATETTRTGKKTSDTDKEKERLTPYQ
jgi:hypothetical protein